MKKRYAFSLATCLLTFPIADINNSNEYYAKNLPKMEIEIKKEFSIKDNYKKLIEAIIHQESQGNPLAYNQNSKATGLMQITPIVLKEWNNFHKNEKYSQRDLYNPKINKKIGEWYVNRIINHYLPHYGSNVNLENLVTAYNWGLKGLREVKDANKNFDKIPKETQKYILDLRKYLEIKK